MACQKKRWKKTVFLLVITLFLLSFSAFSASATQVSVQAFDLGICDAGCPAGWSSYNGGDAPEGAYMGWFTVRTFVNATIDLGQTLPPGEYWVFLKAISYIIKANISVDLGNSTNTSVFDNNDWNRYWTEKMFINTTTNTSNITINFSVSTNVSGWKVLFRGIYITNNSKEIVLSDDQVVELEKNYTTDRDNSAFVKGNLVKNSGFEVGTGHGWGLVYSRGIEISALWDNTNSYEGSSSIKMPLNLSLGALEITSRAHYLKPNKNYTFSVWLKTDTNNTATGKIRLSNTFEPPSGFQPRYYLEQSFSVNETWQRVNVSGPALAYPKSYYQLKIIGNANENKSLWIDALQLEEGNLTNYISKQIDVGLMIDKPANIFYENETANATLLVRNANLTANTSVSVKYEIYNYLNQIVKNGSVNINVTANSTLVGSLNLSSGYRGVFRIHIFVDGVDNTLEELSYSIIPPLRFPEKFIGSMIGTHTNFVDYKLDALKRMGVQWLRAMSPGAYFRWTLAEPQDDNFTWYDTDIQKAIDRNLTILGTIGTNNYWPAWADDNGKPNLTEWEEYVGQIVAHYNQSVDYWEIWNEPNYQFNTTFYAKMLKAASDAINQSDPNSSIIAMAGSGETYMNSTITEIEILYPAWNWSNDLDYFATHAYPGGYSTKLTIGKPYNIPIWNTETGDWDQGFYSGENSYSFSYGDYLWDYRYGDRYYDGFYDSAEEVTINFLQSMGNNLTKYFYYDSRVYHAPDNPDTHPTNFDFDDTLKPKGVAYAIAAYFIDNSTTQGNLSINESIENYLFDREGTPIAAMWTPDQSILQLKISLDQSNFTVYDVMGNTVSISNSTIPVFRTPVYVEGNGINLSVLKNALENGNVTVRSDTDAPNLAIVQKPTGPVLNTSLIRFKWIAIDENYLPRAVNSQYIMYSYMLEGVDSNWTNWTGRTIQEYEYLSGGNYTFRVKAKDYVNNTVQINYTITVLGGASNYSICSNCSDNIFENSNFEVGVGHGWGLDGNSIQQNYPLDIMLDTNFSYHGNYSIKLPYDTNENVQTLISRIYRLTPNNQYTVSLYARSDFTAADFIITATNSFDSPYGAGDSHQSPSFKAPSSGNWTLFNYSFVTTNQSNSSYYFSIAPTHQGFPGEYLWVDALKLEEGYLTNYKQITPIEVGVFTDSNSNVFYDDEQQIINFTAFNYENISNATIRYTITDYYNRTIRNTSLILTVQANKTNKTSVTLGLAKRGSYKINAWIEGMESSVDQTIISIIPRPQTMAINENSSFCTHAPFNDYAMGVMQKVGFKWVRTLSTGRQFRWNVIEKSSDNYTWHDEDFNLSSSYNMSILGVIGSELVHVPSWADNASNSTFPNLTEWQDFVFDVVSHYNDSVKYWEIWNEPDTEGGLGAYPDFYAQLLKIGYNATKSACADCTIVGMVAVYNSFIDSVYNITGPNYLDMQSSHKYIGHETSSYTTKNFVDDYLAVYNKTGWNSETGAKIATWYDRMNSEDLWISYALPSVSNRVYDLRTKALMKNYAITTGYVNNSRSMEKYCYYDSRTSTGPDFLTTYSLFEYDWALRPLAVAYSVLASLFDNSKGKGLLTYSDVNNTAYLYEHNDTTPLAVVWTENTGSKKLVLNLTKNQVLAYDVMGNELPVNENNSIIEIPVSQTPVYLEGQNISLNQLQNSLSAANWTNGTVIQITSHSNGSSVSGFANISINTAPYEEIKRVEYYVDDVLQLNTSIYPYDYIFDSDNFTNNSVILKAVSFDNLQRSGQHSINLILETPICSPNTYYVDFESGDNSNAGNCTTSAWKTIAKVNSANFNPGDNTLFKRGQIWREMLVVPSSGNSTNPIIFSNYGLGELPIISGAINLSNSSYQWSASATSNEWYLEANGGGNPSIGDPGGVWIDDIYQFNGHYTGSWTLNTVGNLSDNNWQWGDNDSLGFNTVYVYQTTDPDVSGVNIEASQRPSVVQITNKDYITFDGLELKHSGNKTIVNPLFYPYQADYVTVNNSKLHDSSGQAGVIYVMRSTNFYLENSEVYDSYDPDGNAYGSLIYFESSSSGQSHNFIIRNNTLYGSYARGADIIGSIGTWSAGVPYGADDGLIENNMIIGPAQNAIYTRSGADNLIIRNNFIKDIKGYETTGGIAIQIRDNSNNVTAYNNIILNVSGPAIQSDGLNGGPGSINASTHDNKYLNNIIYNANTSANAMHFFGNNTNLVVRNNVIVSNTGDMILVGADANDHTHDGITLSNNRYYKNTGTGQEFVYRGTNYLNLSAMKAAMSTDGYPNENNSSYGDPLFVSSNPLNQSDFFYQATSTLVDAGFDLSAYFSTDFDGVSRPQGSGWDIGAYESNYSSGICSPNTYYVDFESGDDSNAGNCTTSAWKHAPGMTGWGGGYSHTAGDRFVFKGGVVWNSSALPLTINFSGNGTNQDYYGVDTNWHSGGSFSRPIFDLQQIDARGIEIDGFENITIDNFEIINPADQAPYATLGLIYVNNVIGDITIQNSVLNGSNGAGDVTGLYLRDVDGITIQNNTLIAKGDDANPDVILIRPWFNMKNIIIKNNEFSNKGTGGDGIHIDVENDFGNSTPRLMQNYGPILIENNSFHDIVGVKMGIIFIGGAENTTVRYNKFYGQFGTGVGVRYGQGNQGYDTPTKYYWYKNNYLYYNTFYIYNDSYPSWGGVLSIYGTNNSNLSIDNFVYNNVIYANGSHPNNQRGAYFEGKNDAAWTLTNNIFVGLTTAINNGTSNPIIDNNIFYNNSGNGDTGTNAILQDPLFVNASASDFRLLNGSPAIDQGTDWGQTRDIIGTLQKGSAWDIGAYESNFSSGTCSANTYYVDTSRTSNGNGSLLNPWKYWSDINWTMIDNCILSSNITIYFSSRDTWASTGSFSITSTGNENYTLKIIGDEKYNLNNSGDADWLNETNSSNRAILTNSGGNGGDINIGSNHYYILIKGFNIVQPTWGGVNLGTVNPTVNLHHITLDNLIVDTPTNNHGIWFGYAEDNSSDIIVKNSLVKNTQLECVYMGHYSYLGNSINGVIIENNTLIDCGLGGEGDIDIKPAVNGSIIRYNKHYRTNSSLDNGSNSGIVVQANNAQIYGNEFYMADEQPSDWGFGIYITSDGDGTTGQAITSVLIYNNLLYNNDRSGIKLTANKATAGASLTGVKIFNNVIWGNRGLGIQASAWNGKNVTIEELKNNIIGNNTGQDVYIAANSNITSANNNLYNRSSGSSWYIFGSSRTWSQWQALGYDANGSVGDPLFESYTFGVHNNSFKLLQGSLAIDSGVDISAYFTTDFDGVTRPQGIAWDIGAYESNYTSGNATCEATSGSCWYVDKDAIGNNNGSNWNNAWINFSSVNWTGINPGDFLYISGGSVNKTYIVSRNGTIRPNSGNISNPITIKIGQDQGHKGIAIIDGNDTYFPIITVQNKNYVTFNGEYNGSRNIILQNSPDTLSIGKNIIEASGSNGIVLTYLEVRDGADGVSFNGGKNATISFNYFHDIRNDYVIKLTNTVGNNYSDISVYNNTIEHKKQRKGSPYNTTCGPDGIQVSGWASIYNNNIVAVNSSDVTGCQHPDGIQCPGTCQYLEIYNNKWSGCGALCMLISNTGIPGNGNILIYNNIFDGQNNSDQMVSIGFDQDLNNFHYVNNIHTDSFQWSAFRMSVDQNVTVTNSSIKNNIFYNTGDTSPTVQSVFFYITISILNNLNFDYNLVNSGAHGNSLIQFNNGSGDQNYVQNNHRNQSPSFINYVEGGQNNDYHLLSNDTSSIDLGTPISFFSTDFDGVTRPQGIAWDIGAYESNYSLSTILSYPLLNGKDDTGQCGNDTNVSCYLGLNTYILPNSDANRVFLRWKVQIPKSATVLNAYIQFNANDTWQSGVNNISLLDEDNSQNFENNPYYRNTTGTVIQWNITTAWIGGQWYNSTEITSLVQEYIDRTGYKPGDYVGLRFNRATGSGWRLVNTYESSPINSAKLIVEYQGGDPVIFVHMAEPYVRIKQKIYVEISNVLSTDRLKAYLDGNLIYEKIGNLLSREVFTSDYTNLTAGNHTIEVLVTNSDNQSYNSSYFNKTWITLHNGSPLVGIDENNAININGTPFFPITPYMYDKSKFNDNYSQAINTLFTEGWYIENNISTWIDYLNSGEAEGWYSVGPGEKWDGFNSTNPELYSNVTMLIKYVNTSKNHTGLMGWTWDDEPPASINPATNIKYWTDLTHQYDTDHPVFINYGGYDYSPNAAPANMEDAKSYSYLYNSEYFNGTNTFVVDVPGFDYYPYENAEDPDAPYISLEDYLDALDNLREWNYNLTPILTFIETQDIHDPNATGHASSCGWPLGNNNWTDDPTPTEVKNLIWSSIIHGAKMIGLFQEFCPTPQENIDALVDFKNHITDLTMVVLGPEEVNVIINQTLNDTGRIDYMIREFNNSIYLIAANIKNSTISANYSINISTSGKIINVFNESRTISFNSDSFTDTFQPLEVHIYEITNQTSSISNIYYIDPDFVGTESGNETNPWTSIGASEWVTIDSALSTNNVTVYYSAREALTDTVEDYGTDTLTVYRNETSTYRVTIDGMSKYNTNDTNPSWQNYSGTKKAKIAWVYTGTGTNRSYVTIRGFELFNSSNQEVYYWGGNNVILEYLHIHNNTQNGATLQFGYAHQEANCSDGNGGNTNLIIRNNVIHDTFGECIYIGGSGNCGLPAHQNILIENNTIYNCAVFGGEGDGIDIKDEITNITIRNNTIYDDYGNSRNGIASHSPFHAYNNLIYDQQNNGISFSPYWGAGINGSLIENNIIFNINGTGIYFGTGNVSRPVNNTVIQHNTIVNSSQGIIVASDSLGGVYNTLIRNNVVVFSNQSGIDGWGDVTNTTFYNNNFYNNTPNYAAPFSDQTGINGSISQDPLFVDYQNADFHLQQTSPCVDAGINSTSLYDFDNNIRPRGNAWDIGAYESNYSVPDVVAPSISSVTNSSITNSSATITWNTNELANSSVNYGNTSSFTNYSINISFVLSHSILLSSLVPNTTIYYNVTSCDSSGNCNMSGVFSFTTVSEWCGDGIINGAEQCDQSVFGGQSCVSLGYDSGSLSCTASCTIITSNCQNDNTGGGGGGGGGAFLPLGTTNITQTFENMSIDKINTITTERTTELLDVSEKTTVSISAPNSELIYKYLEITPIFDKTIVKESTVTFKVNTSWIQENYANVSTIMMRHLINNRWKTLETEYIIQRRGNLYFESKIYNFSIFAITASKNKNESAAFTEELSSENKTIQKQEELQKEKLGLFGFLKSPWFYIPLLSLTLIGIITLIFLSRKRHEVEIKESPSQIKEVRIDKQREKEKKIIDYIDIKRKAGFKINQILTALQNAGWEKNMIIKVSRHYFIRKYIEKAKHEYHSYEDIMNILVQKGWTKQQIQEIFDAIEKSEDKKH